MTTATSLNVSSKILSLLGRVLKLVVESAFAVPPKVCSHRPGSIRTGRAKAERARSFCSSMARTARQC